MAFFMERHLDDTSIQYDTDESPGGVFTLGGTNSSFYQGDIEFLNVASTGMKRWFLNLKSK